MAAANGVTGSIGDAVQCAPLIDDRGGVDLDQEIELTGRGVGQVDGLEGDPQAPQGVEHRPHRTVPGARVAVEAHRLTQQRHRGRGPPLRLDHLEVLDIELRGQLSAWLRHEPGARLGSEPEELHQLRVAVRRIEAALGFFMLFFSE